MTRCFCIALLVLMAAWPLFGSAFAAGVDMERLARTLKTPTLPPTDPVEIRDVEIQVGPARLIFEKGVLFTAAPIEGKVTEMVFLGEGRFVFDPENPLEKQQLDLFTKQETLDTKFHEAVLAITGDDIRASLMGSPKRVKAGGKRLEKSQEIFDRWKFGAERVSLDVPGGLFRFAVGDWQSDQYFAAWIRDSEQGDFLYTFDPAAPESVQAGQIEYKNLTEKEERLARRLNHAGGRKSRFLASLILGQGTLNTWVSYSPEEDGKNRPPESIDFEPERYVLDVTISKGTRKLMGKARLELQPPARDRTTLVLEMNPVLEVEKVATGSGKELFFFRAGRDLFVHLPDPLPDGHLFVLDVTYSGDLLVKNSLGSFWLADTEYWYPHAGRVDRAKYEVTLHWPKGRDILSAGKLVASGVEKGDLKWERRVLDAPVSFFTFELGDFKMRRETVGHVEVTVAFDKTAKYMWGKEHDEIFETVIDSLKYYEEMFGAYPLDELKVATIPRDFSQGSLGFITLSSLAMFDWGSWSWLFGVEDRRTVIAHEMAHQWWGNLIGFQSYRDQWISEAIANYASLVYARDQLSGGRKSAPGPITGWRKTLNRRTKEGRTVESIGPLVLGPRLSSTLSRNAYQSIVYTKGAMVLDMLAGIFPKGMFNEMLKKLAQYGSFREISTETFIGSLEKMSEMDLGWFTRQYIYGTGIPEVIYRFEFVEGEGGQWSVRGEAHQNSPLRYKYRLVDIPGGGLDVRKEWLEGIDVSHSNLVVPFAVGVYSEEMDKSGGKKKKGDPAREINAELKGRLLLEGEVFPFKIDIDYQPLDFWLDKYETVLALFICESRMPKQVMYWNGMYLVAAGHFEDAVEKFKEAVRAESIVSTNPNESVSESNRSRQSRYWNRKIYLGLARMYLDLERDREAAKILDQLPGLIDVDSYRSLRADLMVLQSRLDLHRGDFASAYERLRKGLGKKGVTRGTEAHLLLAIAARATNHPDDVEEGLRVAKNRGVDVSLLEEEN